MNNSDNHLPLLRNWRVAAGCKLVGEVTGHPELADGWMLTSRLVSAPDPTTRLAHCESRIYRLGEPWPVDQPMPAAAVEILFAGILRNLQPFPVADLPRAREAATTLAKAALQPHADPWSAFEVPV